MSTNDHHLVNAFSEADTCREYVTPAIQAAGWGDSPSEIAEQRSFTDDRIVLTGRTARLHKYIPSNFLRPHHHDRLHRQWHGQSNSDAHLSLTLAATVGMLESELSL